MVEVVVKVSVPVSSFLYSIVARKLLELVLVADVVVDSALGPPYMASHLESSWGHLAYLRLYILVLDFPQAWLAEHLVLLSYV